MEDELNYLTYQTFLIKKDNKYETAFPIVSKDAQEKVWNYNCRVISSLTDLFTKLIDEKDVPEKFKKEVNAKIFIDN